MSVESPSVDPTAEAEAAACAPSAESVVANCCATAPQVEPASTDGAAAPGAALSSTKMTSPSTAFKDMMHRESALAKLVSDAKRASKRRGSPAARALHSPAGQLGILRAPLSLGLTQPVGAVKTGTDAPPDGMETDAQMCLVRGDVLCMSRQITSFTIIACNAKGLQRRQGGDPFLVSVRGASVVKPRLIDQSDGTYKVEWKPSVSGRYYIAISLLGTALPDSPLAVNVITPCADALKCSISGGALHSMTARLPSSFEVDFVDAFGQVAHAEELDVFVVHRDDTGPTIVEDAKESLRREKERREAEEAAKAAELMAAEAAAEAAAAEAAAAALAAAAASRSKKKGPAGPSDARAKPTSSTGKLGAVLDAAKMDTSATPAVAADAAQASSAQAAATLATESLANPSDSLSTAAANSSSAFVSGADLKMGMESESKVEVDAATPEPATAAHRSGGGSASRRRKLTPGERVPNKPRTLATWSGRSDQTMAPDKTSASPSRNPLGDEIASVMARVPASATPAEAAVAASGRVRPTSPTSDSRNVGINPHDPTYPRLDGAERQRYMRLWAKQQADEQSRLKAEAHVMDLLAQRVADGNTATALIARPAPTLHGSGARCTPPDCDRPCSA